LFIVSSGDQATYLTIGYGISHGAKLYADLWDPKSPGFLLFYSWVLAVNKSLFFSNLVGLFVISTTACLLAKVSDRLGGYGWMTGLTYVLISSVYETNFATTPEPLVVLCSAMALTLMDRRSLIALAGAGACLGAALVCKYPAGLEFVGLGLWWIYRKTRERASVGEIVAGSAAALVGALAVVGAMVAWFAVSGTLSNLWRDNIAFDLFHYGNKWSPRKTLEALEFFVQTYPVFLALGILGIVGLGRSRPQTGAVSLLVLWGCSSLIEIFMPGGSVEGQYWFQLWGVLSLIIPWGIQEALSNQRSPWAPMVLILVLAVTLTAANRLAYEKPDTAGDVAKYLAPRMSNGDRVFIDSGPAQAVYYLLETPPPSKYVHGSGRPDGETQRIFDSKPRFVVMEADNDDYAFKARWHEAFLNYHLVQRIDFYEIYELTRL
jgi:hypothetical protein